MVPEEKSFEVQGRKSAEQYLNPNYDSITVSVGRIHAISESRKPRAEHALPFTVTFCFECALHRNKIHVLRFEEWTFALSVVFLRNIITVEMGCSSGNEGV